MRDESEEEFRRMMSEEGYALEGATADLACIARFRAAQGLLDNALHLVVETSPANQTNVQIWLGATGIVMRMAMEIAQWHLEGPDEAPF
jgi:hypothetical protein